MTLGGPEAAPPGEATGVRALSERQGEYLFSAEIVIEAFPEHAFDKKTFNNWDAWKYPIFYYMPPMMPPLA